MTSFEEMSAEAIIRRSRTMLVLGVGDEPFYGSIALGLELIENPFVPTAMTDGFVLIYNPVWIKSLKSIEEAMGLMEHEVLHGALKHPLRVGEMAKMPNFNMDIWQKATDYAINPILLNKGRQLPGGGLFDARFDGMAAERIYGIIFDEEQKALKQKTKTGSGSGKGSSQSPKTPPGKSSKSQDSGQKASSPGSNGSSVSTGKQPDKSKPNKAKSQSTDLSKIDLTKATDPGGCGGVMQPINPKTMEPLKGEELKAAAQDFENRVVNAARQIEKNQGNIPGFIKEIIEAHTTPQVTYKDHLWDLMERITRDDYCMSRPNKRFEDIYLPSMYNKELEVLVIVIDTSGSVSHREKEIYAGEISGILEEFAGTMLRIVVIYHDTRVSSEQELTPDDLPLELTFTGGGGTHYPPVFEHIEKAEYDPKAVIWFTDLEVGANSYSVPIPEYELFWLNTSTRRYSTPPFGTILDLDPNV